MLLVPMIVAAIVVLFVAIVIVPKFREIQAVLMEGSAPEEIQRLRVGLSNFGTEDMTTLPSDATLATWAVGLIVVFGLIAFIFTDGPQQLARWTWWPHGLRRIWDRLAMRLPWHRQRVLRDFVEALGILLDADVPEAEAVMLAAESTGSVVLQELAGRVVGDLQVGQKLVAALERIDSTGELHWRVANAVNSASGFGVSLRAWQEMMEIEAWKSEARASQVVSTVAVGFTGVVVAMVCMRIVVPLIEMVEGAALW